MTTEEAIKAELLRYVKACELVCKSETPEQKQHHRYLAHVRYKALIRLKNAN